MTGPVCGAQMNRHAEKLVHDVDPARADATLGGVLVEVYRCPRCGAGAAREVAATTAR